MTMRCEEILILTGWDVKERKECVCFSFRIGQNERIWSGVGMDYYALV